jgi:hypothetical protein
VLASVEARIAIRLLSAVAEATPLPPGDASETTVARQR